MTSFAVLRSQIKAFIRMRMQRKLRASHAKNIFLANAVFRDEIRNVFSIREAYFVSEAFLKLVTLSSRKSNFSLVQNWCNSFCVITPFGLN